MAGEETSDPGLGKTPDPRNRISESDYLMAVDEYELGVAGIVDLADKIGCSRQALSKRFKADGIKKSSRAEELSKAKEEAQIAAVKAAAERFSARREEWIEETRIEGVKALKQASMIARKLVIDQLKKPGAPPLGEIDIDLRAMQRFNKILVDNITATLQILQADDFTSADELPTLNIEDLTENEVLDHHKRTGAIPDDMTLKEFKLEELSFDDEPE